MKLVEENRKGIMITVFSTASAVGKTLVSTNMAAELARQGFRVCLLDFDLQFGDVCNYLHLHPEFSVADAQRAIKTDRDGFSPQDYLIEYRHERVAFSVLPAPLRLDEAYNISADAAENIAKRLQMYFDYIVLDTTSAFGELNLAMMDMSTIITFLGIVDFIPTIKNMKIGCDTMHGIGYDANRIRLVLNRSNSKTKIELDDVEQLLGEKFYHVLPNDFQAAQHSIQEGVPLVLSRQGSVLADGLRSLVGRYTNHSVEDESAERGNSSWLKRIFGK